MAMPLKGQQSKLTFHLFQIMITRNDDEDDWQRKGEEEEKSMETEAKQVNRVKVDDWRWWG